MKKIEFYNIFKQDKHIHKKIISKLSNRIRKNKFILENDVYEFEKNFSKFCGTKYAIGVANGSDALFIAVKALNLRKNDEIIVPAMTWKSTLMSVINNGIKPVLVDIEKNTSNINLKDLKKRITSRTKAIIVVHLYGNPGKITEIKKIIKNKKIKIIEDAAQAQGAVDFQNKKKIGSLGDIGCFSFYPGKNLGAYGDAGGLTTNNLKLFNLMNKIKNNGTYNKFNKSDCDVEGINSRLDNLQAMILNIKLKNLIALNNRRVEIAKKYNSQINNPKIKKLIYGEGSVFHQYVVKVNSRKKFINYLKKYKIGFGIHYKSSLNNLKLIKNKFKKYKYPNAVELSKKGISIPIDPSLKNSEINRIINILNNY